MAFELAGEQTTPFGRTSAGLLTIVRHWQLPVDLKHKLRFPSAVAVTILWPDTGPMSQPTLQAVMLELTIPIPWEYRLGVAFERKLSKYAHLARG